jgi:dipeptidase E
MKLDLGPRRRVVFYSGGQTERNNRIHEGLAALTRGKSRSITYVPFTHENGERYFARMKKRYRRFGFKKFRYFAVDSDFLAREMNEAFKSDVIYLAGGNTFYFLKHLRESGFLKRLERFAKRGGIIAGLSAGAIILTPTIHLAGYPLHNADENEVRLKDLRGLGLVDFEFYPHYVNSKKTNSDLLRYSRRTKRPILACEDGGGVILAGGTLQLFGGAHLFYRGKRVRLNAAG